MTNLHEIGAGSPAHRPATKGRVLHGAALYDLLTWLFLFGRERAFRDRLVTLAQLRAGETVLDIGCGTGTLAIAAKRRVGFYGAVHAIDASPAMIARARTKAHRAGVQVEFREGVVEALPFAAASFDVVLSTMMLHHLPARAREQCLREVRRVLKANGRALFVDFAPPRNHKGFLDRFHRHGFVKLDELIEMVRVSGLHVTESRPLGLRNLHFIASTPA